MIAIRFKPCFEDRASIFLKQSRLKDLGIKYEYTDTPSVYGEEQRLCYWIIYPRHNNQINPILSELKEMKDIMGVEDLQFQYVYNMKEYYCQYDGNRSIIWFDI